MDEEKGGRASGRVLSQQKQVPMEKQVPIENRKASSHGNSEENRCKLGGEREMGPCFIWVSASLNAPDCMPAARPFLFDGSQAGCFHVVSRLLERRYLLDDEGKEVFMKMVRAYEDVLGVEVLT